MQDFIDKYFIKPIINYEGYNIVNTTTYAIIAIFGLYLTYKYFKKNNIDFDGHFFKSLIPFVFFGSIKRVITDAVNAGIAQGWPYAPFYEYNIFNVTPGIYVITSLLFLSSFIIEKKIKARNLCFYFGLFLAFIHAFLLLPFLIYYDRAILVLFISSA
ncbi:MAG: DUF63 family protein, partial [Candidatus Anstonellales archaeon]